MKKNLLLCWFDVVLSSNSIEKSDIVCLFVELFAEMVLMVDVSDCLEDKIMKKVDFFD